MSATHHLGAVCVCVCVCVDVCVPRSSLLQGTDDCFLAAKQLLPEAFSVREGLYLTHIAHVVGMRLTRCLCVVCAGALLGCVFNAGRLQSGWV